MSSQRIGAGFFVFPAARMKNMSSLLAKSLRGLKSNCRILLTGTPVQNALQDWSAGVGVGRYFHPALSEIGLLAWLKENIIQRSATPQPHHAYLSLSTLPALLGQHLNCVIVSHSLHIHSSLDILNLRRTCGLSWILHNLVCWETMPRWDTWKDGLSHF